MHDIDVGLNFLAYGIVCVAMSRCMLVGLILYSCMLIMYGRLVVLVGMVVEFWENLGVELYYDIKDGWDCYLQQLCC